ncbi:MAG: EAL domain-containing protein [Candidatus Zapsychrus exili]|nr:EAL domain-containing protein [Candidatus Zapsychrus exili]
MKFKFLNNMNIQKKLMFIILLTAVTSLLLASICFAVYELFSFKITLGSKLHEINKIISNKLEEPLKEKDIKALSSIVNSLETIDYITLSKVVDSTGKTLAQYKTANAKTAGTVLPTGIYSYGNRIHSYYTIKNDTNRLGSLYIQSDLSQLTKRLSFYLRIILVIILFIFLVAKEISSRLQRIISDPILNLLDTSKQVSINKNYSLRTPKTTSDEIGDLTDAFNSMLSETDKANKKLLHAALYDNLTNLPNRTLFIERLERTIQHKKRKPDFIFAVIFIDLNRFKIINDTLGHIKGDKILMKTAKRLKKSIRENDTIARFGGDEFIVLLNDLAMIGDVKVVLDRLVEIFKKPIKINKQDIYVSVSMGVVLSDKKYSNVREYLQMSDNAMYHAKSTDRCNYKVFDGFTKDDRSNIINIESDLRKAIENNEFEVYYQPIVSCKTKEIVQLEALIRWNHPKHGIVSPDTFIPLSEEIGLIDPIGRWVFKSVCKQISTWKQNKINKCRTSINVSAKQLEHNDLIKFFKETIDEHNVDASCVEIELTESFFVHNIDAGIEFLNNLRDIGITSAMDDFGTGYSSLNSLMLFPFDNLKIDKCFIQMMHEKSSNCHIVEAIINMGHNLDFKIIAEGVENEYQANILKQYKCDYLQGFLFHKPLPASKITKLLKSQKN